MEKQKKLIGKRLDDVILSILKTISGEDERKADCFAQCAKFFKENNDKNQESLEIFILGYGGYPTHGVVVKDENIVLDSVGRDRMLFNKKRKEIVYKNGLGNQLNVLKILNKKEIDDYLNKNKISKNKKITP